MSIARLSKVEAIVVHCSATPATMDIGAAEIDRWHRQRGFLRIGYHYVIRRDGTREAGRSLDQVGSHAQGHNSTTLAVCLVGGINDAKLQKPQANFTEAQLQTLWATVRELQGLHPQARVIGHRDLPGVAKACPSFDVQHWLKTREVRA
jgi:N-acetylmuramoyl-L-alanine amidase